MKTYKEYPYQSALAPYIRDFLSEKRALGFIYEGKSYQLFRLDQYWLNNDFHDACLTYSRLENWLCALPGESRSSQNSRVGAARSLAIYLTSHGILCDIPIINVGKDHPVIHILDKTELHELFQVIDTYIPHSGNPADFRMVNEYPIIFRLFYCCGMRNNEVCSLKTTDIDLNNGIINIFDGKGQKDRLVYLPDDLRVLRLSYCSYIKRELGYEPYWFFPGRFPDKHIPKTSIDRTFQRYWGLTASSLRCDRIPTPHSLRHGFVVDRINSWIMADVDINVMFTYLSKYLGHKDPNESFYYYHLVNDAFRIIRKKDTMSADVIPEVRRR